MPSFPARSSFLAVCCLLGGCGLGIDTTPTDKTVHYDMAKGTLAFPACPDWSQSSTMNYDNSVHSNYGCAVNRNLAVQLADPSDLHHGKGDGMADTTEAARTITRYRAGEIPQPLQPQQSASQ